MNSFYEQLNSVPDEDINVAAPSEYVDSGFGLIPEATYDLLVKDFEPIFKDDGTFSKRILIKSAEIAGVPEEDLKKYLGRKVNNLAVFTTVYQRNGVPASGLGDLVRGIDDERSWTGLKEATDIIQEAVDKNTPIQMKLVWGAYDSKGFDAAGGKMLVSKSQEEKELRKKASVKGMRNFRQLPDGSYSPDVLGPLSGDMLEGRLEIDRVIPKKKRRPMLAA
jgi:hypothetical protein